MVTELNFIALVWLNPVDDLAGAVDDPLSLPDCCTSSYALTRTAAHLSSLLKVRLDAGEGNDEAITSKVYFLTLLLPPVYFSLRGDEVCYLQLTTCHPAQISSLMSKDSSSKH